jgi:tetratricopeptide (TPR) repeat protein
MNRHSVGIVFLLVSLALCSAIESAAQPEPVPEMTKRPLDKASYVALAKEWEKYIEEHGESAVAYYNMGMAYHYSGEIEAALVAAERAFALEPENPGAIAFLAKILSIKGEDYERALELLERCREIAPGHEQCLTTLVAVHLKRGELSKADEVFEAIFERRIIPGPLQDYAYNMLVGLPHGAVLITNGDNDTFPPLALQAGMDFRRDVIVINRHLLGIREFAEAVFERYPAVKPKGDLPGGKGPPLAAALIGGMIEDKKIPVYIATSVPLEDLGIDFPSVAEGLNWRTSKTGMTSEGACRLFLEKYRLDSATDWNVAWSLMPSISSIMQNYITAIIHHVQEGKVDAETKEKVLDKALEIAQFHDMARASITIKSLKGK